MKHFACGSVLAGCHAVFDAADEEEILHQMADHATRDHALTLASPALLEAIRQKITTVPAEL